MLMSSNNVPCRNLVCLAGLTAFILGLVIYHQVSAAFLEKSGLVFSQNSSQNSSFSIWQTLESGKLGGRISPQIYAGYRFSPQKDGYATELCGYFTGVKSVNLYDSFFNLLASSAIRSEEGWVCASVPPVSLRQGENYYVAAEMDGGIMYYRYRISSDLFPLAVHDVEIKEGVYQSLSQPFGTGLIADRRAVYGLVDIGFETGSREKNNSSAFFPASGDNESVIKNCAGGVCVNCSQSGCFEKKTSEDDSFETFLEVCASGSCLSCRKSKCDSVKAEKWSGQGVFFVKNCVGGQCVNCFNGECFVSGAETTSDQSFGCGGRFCETDKIVAGGRSFNNVFGGCAKGNCGRGGIYFESGTVAESDQKNVSRLILTGSGKKIANSEISGNYSVVCDNGVCDLCAAKQCVKVGMDPKAAVVESAIQEENDQKVLAVKIGSAATDAEPPVIFNLRPSGLVGESLKTLTCDTDEDSFCKLCSIDQPFSEMCETFGETGGKHHSQVVGQLSSGDYKYYVKCRDRTGNENRISSQITFRVMGEKSSGSKIDLEPPIISSPAAGIRSNGIFTIEAAVFDNTGIGQIKARIKDSKGGCFAVVYLGDTGLNGDRKAADGIYTANWPANGEDLTKASVEIIASDNFGNFSSEEIETKDINPGTESAEKSLNSDNSSKVFILDLSFDNKDIFLNSISTGMAVFRETGYPDNSFYVARLIGASGEVLGSYGLDLPWKKCVADNNTEVASQENKDGCQKQPSATLSAKVPYRAEARTIDIYDPDGKVALSVEVFDLVNFCGNLVCEKGEDGANCKKDCSLSVKDGYCNGVVDGFCDPDCSSKSDPDCQKTPPAISVILTAAALMPILLIGVLTQKRSFWIRGNKKG